LFRRGKKEQKTPEEIVLVEQEPKPQEGPKKAKSKDSNIEEVDLVVIGAGVSGLTAALTAAESSKKIKKSVVLEASDKVGGRVTSDKTSDGYILDRGFAVFIEEYPTAKQVLNLTELELKPFLPGALVKIPKKNFRIGFDEFERVADPLRQPLDIFTALFADVGTISDKFRVLSLIAHVNFNTVEELFKEPETDTLTCLNEKYGFSDKFIDEFLKPFLEGIYLAPLNEQSSRMFHFVFKMFSEGAATLPAKGMQAVSDQLADKCQNKGVEIRCKHAVQEIQPSNDGSFLVEYKSNHEQKKIRTKSIILATDGIVATKLIKQIDEFASVGALPQPPQRRVACRYYGFPGTAPITDPILILNGERVTQDYDLKSNPVNNICFPSVLSSEYAPESHSLCSVTILSEAMKLYENDDAGLDKAVRQQLSKWFPFYEADILDSNRWKTLGSYKIDNAQPGQLDGPWAAKVHGGRDCSKYRGKSLPKGFYVCGDHMATATLNGAMESGVNAGKAAAGV